MTCQQVYEQEIDDEVCKLMNGLSTLLGKGPNKLSLSAVNERNRAFQAERKKVEEEKARIESRRLRDKQTALQRYCLKTLFRILPYLQETLNQTVLPGVGNEPPVFLKDVLGTLLLDPLPEKIQQDLALEIQRAFEERRWLNKNTEEEPPPRLRLSERKIANIFIEKGYSYDEASMLASATNSLIQELSLIELNPDNTCYVLTPFGQVVDKTIRFEQQRKMRWKNSHLGLYLLAKTWATLLTPFQYFASAPNDMLNSIRWLSVKVNFSNQSIYSFICSQLLCEEGG